MDTSPSDEAVAFNFSFRLPRLAPANDTFRTLIRERIAAVRLAPMIARGSDGLLPTLYAVYAAIDARLKKSEEEPDDQYTVGLYALCVVASKKNHFVWEAVLRAVFVDTMIVVCVEPIVAPPMGDWPTPLSSL